jgi:hypothetical protein
MESFRVITTQKIMPFDVVIHEHSIEGSLRGESYINRQVVPEVKSDASQFKFCGYNFLVMEYIPYSQQFRVRLAAPQARVIKALEGAGRLLRDINYRLILTAYVWGLQDKPREGEIIRWRRKR